MGDRSGIGKPLSQQGLVPAAGWSGRLAGLLIAGVPIGIVPATAWGQAAGDSVGSLFSGGNLRGTLEALLPNRPRVNTGLAWQTSGSLEVDVGATDNPGGLNNQHKWSFTTFIQPSFALTGDSPRLSAQFYYSPAVVLYSNASGQNTVSHNLNAGATATLWPEHLFLDVRAYASDQPNYGSAGTFTTTQALPFNSGSASQTAGVSVSPYYQQRFGGWGTLRLAYALTHTFVGNLNNSPPVVQSTNLPGFATTGNLTTHTETASFTTGENFNRFNYTFDASTYQYSGGSGNLQVGNNYFINNAFSYATTHEITLLATVGYQTVSYGGATPFQADYVNWTVGTRLTPNPDSSLTIQYGESQGQNTWLFDGRYSPTPRLSFYGSYTTSITTYLQQQQALLQGTVVGPNGILVDRTTGAPVTAVNPLGVQNAPSRVYQLTLGAGYVINRESFSAAVTRSQSTTLTQSSSAIGTTVASGTTGTGTTGSLSWQHDIDPATSLTSSVGYGVSNGGAFFGSPGSSVRTFSASANLSHIINESLTGNVSYSYSERSGLGATTIQGAGNASQNLFLVGLRKTF